MAIFLPLDFFFFCHRRLLLFFLHHDEHGGGGEGGGGEGGGGGGGEDAVTPTPLGQLREKSSATVMSVRSGCFSANHVE